MKVLLPDSIALDPALPDGVEAYVYDNSAPIPDEHLDADVLVLWSYSRKRMADAARRMTGLRLIQSLSAGTDTIEQAGFADDVVISSGVGLHDVMVAEHTLALLLALVRRIPDSLAAQARREWSWELMESQQLPPGGRPATTLHGARVLVWGFGSIGQHLAPMLSALGAEVTGVARSAGTRGGYDVVSEDRLDEELARADALVMILPDTPTTVRALDARRIAELKEHALVVNVGRGATVDETALLEGLNSGHVGGAGLDVTAQEPLPADSPLWDAPRTIITPHVAGGRPLGADELIAANVEALARGTELRNVVER